MSFAFEDILFYYYGVRLTFYVLFVTCVFFVYILICSVLNCVLYFFLRMLELVTLFFKIANSLTHPINFHQFHHLLHIVECGYS